MKRRLYRPAPPSGELSAAAMAPMVDVMTLVLVVLLRTWSADAPASLAEEGMELPMARSEDALAGGVFVDIGISGLYVNGWRAGSVAFWSQQEGALITDLYEALQARGGDRVLVRANKDAPWSLIGKVLYTAQQAGYKDVQIVATSQASL